MIKQYDERIMNILKDSFKSAINDDEWKDRSLMEWNYLFEDIDKIIEYVNNGKKGNLLVYTNMWYVLRDALDKIASLYDLEVLWLSDKGLMEEHLIAPIQNLYIVSGDGFEVSPKYKDKLCTIEDLKCIYEKEIIECMYNNKDDETIQNAWCKELVRLINGKISGEEIINELKSLNYFIDKVGI